MEPALFSVPETHAAFFQEADTPQEKNPAQICTLLLL